MNSIPRKLLTEASTPALPACIAIVLIALYLWQITTPEAASPPEIADSSTSLPDCMKPSAAIAQPQTIITTTTTAADLTTTATPSASPPPFPWPAHCRTFLQRVTAPTIRMSFKLAAQQLVEKYGGDEERIEDITAYLVQNTNIPNEQSIADLDRALGWELSYESEEAIVDEYQTKEREVPRTKADNARLEEFMARHTQRLATRAANALCTVLELEPAQQQAINTLLSQRSRAEPLLVDHGIPPWRRKDKDAMEKIAKSITEEERTLADRKSSFLAEVKAILSPEQHAHLEHKLNLADSEVSTVSKLLKATE